MSSLQGIVLKIAESDKTFRENLKKEIIQMRENGSGSDSWSPEEINSFLRTLENLKK